MPDINTRRELREYWFKGVGKEKMETYFDYQAFRRDIESKGGFTSYGYLEIRS
ncbi:hypothetical protein [Streptococcus porcinus]|uniref:hypothetical protein n=1 Tax=Streptococcus porcinus TaxID=1340 RepID=UPI0035A918CD